MRVLPALIIAIFLMALHAAQAQDAEPGRSVNIILDSDIVGDADDVSDQAVVWPLADCGQTDVGALITSSANDHSAPNCECARPIL